MKICLITSTRADFGLLKKLILKLKANNSFNVKIIASGTHYNNKFGLTYKEIKKNKIKINNKIIFNYNSDNEITISKIFSETVFQTTKIIKKNKPDLIIVLGDRYEILASVISANINRVPVAHIHGGEVTSGVMDDSFRHAITKLSHIHFVANNVYKKRVIQLGENPKHVYVVGGLGVDSIFDFLPIKKKILEKKLKIKFNKKNYIVNFHPETLKKSANKKYIKIILSAIKKIKFANFLFTMPGFDIENYAIIEEIKKFVKKNKNTFFIKSLGQLNYYSILNYMNGMIGNSSSGILEMPYFKKGTINLGMRQNGRLKSNTVIDCEINKSQILRSIKKIESPQFQKILKSAIPCYGKPGASTKIVNILKKKQFKKLVFKKFYDFNNI
jgi:GDP/UDP-N,N'-diacetylbacillosamine 2-epimerase (hydrolysing)